MPHWSERLSPNARRVMLAMGSLDVVNPDDDEDAVSVDDDGPEPIFARLSDDEPDVVPSDALPPERWTLQRIARDLDVSDKTVQRGLRELEAAGLVDTRREPTPGRQGPGELVARLVKIDEDGRPCFAGIVRGVMRTVYAFCACDELAPRPAEIPPGRGQRFRAAPAWPEGFAGGPTCPTCSQLRRADRAWKDDAERLLAEVGRADLDTGRRPTPAERVAVVADRLRDRPGVTPDRVARLQKKITGQRAAFARATGCRRPTTSNG